MTSIADLLIKKLTTDTKADVVSAVNEVNTKTVSHSGNASIHVTSSDKDKIALIKDGTTSQKGLVQLNDAVNSTSTSQAATANAVKKAYDLANTANSKTYTPPTSSTSAAGIVQLNDAVDSTSTSQAATANAVKKAYDLASGKYSKPSTGISKSDLASDVQASLGKADAAATHQNDYVKHPGVATTTNNGNAYAVTLNPAPENYSNGMGLVLTINADSTGPATINVNGKGAKAIKSASGEDVELKANGIYTLRYNAVTGNFITQGEGGGGSAKGLKFSKVYLSPTEPTNPSENDIWALIDKPIRNVYFEEASIDESTLSVGDVIIGIGSVTEVLNHEIKKGSMSIHVVQRIPEITNTKRKVMSSELMDIYANLGSIKIVDAVNSTKYVSGFVYVNGNWVQFCIDDNVQWYAGHNITETSSSYSPTYWRLHHYNHEGTVIDYVDLLWSRDSSPTQAPYVFPAVGIFYIPTMDRMALIGTSAYNSNYFSTKLKLDLRTNGGLIRIYNDGAPTIVCVTRDYAIHIGGSSQNNGKIVVRRLSETSQIVAQINAGWGNNAQVVSQAAFNNAYIEKHKVFVTQSLDAVTTLSFYDFSKVEDGVITRIATAKYDQNSSEFNIPTEMSVSRDGVVTLYSASTKSMVQYNHRGELLRSVAQASDFPTVSRYGLYNHYAQGFGHLRQDRHGCFYLGMKSNNINYFIKLDKDLKEVWRKQIGLNMQTRNEVLKEDVIILQGYGASQVFDVMTLDGNVIYTVGFPYYAVSLYPYSWTSLSPRMAEFPEYW